MSQAYAILRLSGESPSGTLPTPGARNSLKRLLDHRDADSCRQFPRVNCWWVARYAATRIGVPGRCGLLRVSPRQAELNLWASTMAADREIRSGTLELVLVMSAVNAQGDPPVVFVQRKAERRHSRTLRPGWLARAVSFALLSDLPQIHPWAAAPWYSLFLCPILLLIGGARRLNR